MLGDECFIGEDAVLGAGVKVFPFKTVEAGGRRQLLDRLGEPGRPQPVRPRRRRRPGQRRHHPRAGHQARHGLGHHAEEGLARSSPPATPVALGPHAQAGDDGRAQRRRASTCSTSRWPRCRSPGSSSASPSPPAACSVRLVEGDPQSVVIRFFDDRRRSTSPRTPSARSSACSTGRTSAGCSRARSATSASRPGPSSTTPPRSRPPSTSAPSPAPASRSWSTTATARTSFVMPNVLAKLGADVLAVNPYASTAGAMDYDAGRHAANVAALVTAAGAHLGAVHRPRRRAAHADRRRRAGSSPTPRPCWRSSAWSSDHLVGDQVALPVTATMPRRRASSSPTACRSAGPRSRRRPSWTPPPRTGRRASPPASTAASSSPASCPPSTPPPRSSSCSSCWPVTGVAPLRGGRRPAPAPHGPRDRRHPVGAEGHVMRSLVERAGPRRSCSSTG